MTAHLLTLVTEHRVGRGRHRAAHDVAKKAVQFRGRVRRPRERPAAEAHRRQVEVAAVFLHEQVGGGLRRAEEAVQRAVDPQLLTDPVPELVIRVVPAGLELNERNLVRRVAVHLVRREEHERRLGTLAPRRLEQRQRPDRVHLEVVDGARSGEIV